MSEKASCEGRVGERMRFTWSAEASASNIEYYGEGTFEVEEKAAASVPKLTTDDGFIGKNISKKKFSLTIVASKRVIEV